MSALQTIAYVLKSKKPASKALNCFNLYPQILKNLSVSSKPSLEALENYQSFLKSIEAHNIRHLIRYSGTENKLRILLEGKDVKLLDKAMLECEEYFRGKIC